MKNIQYKKSGATVSVSQDEATQTYKIERNGKILEMSFTRQQEIKNISQHGGYYEPRHQRGDCAISYNIGVKIGEAEQNFSASFSKEVFGQGDKTPVYDSDFEEKGIPAEEYKLLYKALSDQNTAVAQVMDSYVLNADELQKCNNLQQSLFNQKLEEFLSFNK